MPGTPGVPETVDAGRSQSVGERLAVEAVLHEALQAGRLNEFFEVAFEEVIQSAPPDLFAEMKPEIRAAFEAYRACKQAQGGAAMETEVRRSAPGRPQTIPLAYAGKWLAWSEDGLRIVAVGDSFEACEQAAVEAGFAANRVAVDRAPMGRFRMDGDDV